MRTPRTEIVSVDTARFARHAFVHSLKWAVVCQAEPVANGTRITVSPVADWSPKPVEYWLQQPRDATKIIDELFTIDELASSRMDDGSVLVEADLQQVDAAIWNCAIWRLVKIAPRAEVDEHIASVESEIKRSLVRLQLTGAMSALNKEYKALQILPRVEGERLPSFKTWMTAQLEAQLLQKLMPAAA